MTQKIMNVTLEEIIDGRYRYYLSEYHLYYKEMIKVTLKLMQKYKGSICLANTTQDKYELFPKCMLHFPNGLIVEFGELSGALGFADRFEVFVHYCVPRKRMIMADNNDAIKTNFFQTYMKHHTHFEMSNLDVKEEYSEFYHIYDFGLCDANSSCVIKPMDLEKFAEAIASFDKNTFKVEKNYFYNLFEIMMGKSKDIRKHRKLVYASRNKNFNEISEEKEYLEAKDVVFILG